MCKNEFSITFYFISILFICPVSEIKQRPQEMDKELHSAISSGQLGQVRQLIQQGASLNMLFGMKGTPLCAAVYAHKPDIVDYLLSSGCDVNAKDYDGEPPLCLALRMEIYELAQKLINVPLCDVNKRDPVSGDCPMHIVVRKNHLNFVKTLIKRNCKLNVRNFQGKTPLHLAIIGHNFEISKHLIDHGCDLLMMDDVGRSPPHSCIVEKEMSVLSYIMERLSMTSGKCKTLDDNGGIADFKTKTNSDTFLTLAVRSDNYDAVELLLNYKCELDFVNDKGETALYLACKMNHTDITLTLLQAGASPNGLCERNTKTVQGVKSKPPIHEAVAVGNLLLVKKLVEYKADLDVCNDAGESPLHTALRRSKAQIADFLLEEYQRNPFNIHTTTQNRQNLLFAVASCTNPAYFAQRFVDVTFIKDNFILTFICLFILTELTVHN